MSTQLRMMLGLLGMLAAVVWVAPVAIMVMASLKPDASVLPEAGSWRALFPSEITWRNYSDMLSRSDFWRLALNSLLIVGGIVAGGVIVNGLCGYALARLRWPGRSLVMGAVLALLVLPLESIAVPLFHQATRLGWRDTYTVQIVPFVANALSIHLFYSFFAGLPRELEESARLDGAGPWRTLWSVILPNARPVLATVTIVNFLLYWGLYIWPLLVTSGPDVRPLPLGLAVFRTLPPLQWGDLMAFAVAMVAPVIVVFLVFQRWFVRGVAATGRKG